ncbi:MULTISPECIES: type II secretion system protein N [Rubrivivax]|uniref:Type II secretion system protein N n=2 Tax=Rubrivivax benzoatilyticus TaxID=316997 RepID=A0ABX0HUC7_9BURK|nr:MULTISPECIES: type II secretion system protein N [Rubrivivax]MCC9598573.1 type II secretion system protein N [Rubrivivax sp. JA1055]MCC9648274.1 type II secretion system protein N [Rubrivivax sp. JA1029]NHK96999.1 type II secretion system protein GspN [Rubrivivax benzoatilyticus]NHL24714.1 type II secretion system protein GspN [Rubrivivax benzoatilyticus]
MSPPAPASRPRAGARRWAAAGALLGGAAALVAFAPASWLAGALATASGQRLLLADARGSIWNGSAVAVLSGGPGSRDAAALPGRLHWTLRPAGAGIALRARQACCIDGELALLVEPGLGRLKISLPAGPVGRWPAAWLAGLGTPFNTLGLGGTVALASQGLVAESAAGRWRLAGGATLVLEDMSSRVSTLERLGSYRLALAGGDVPQLTLATQQGPLLLSGDGQWSGRGLRFRGEAAAAPGAEPVLNNLLNIIGRRQGTKAVISIG